jgi:uncharacterized protein (DUF1330 family)
MFQDRLSKRTVSDRALNQRQQEAHMTAYVIFIRDSTSDAAEMATYAQMARTARAGHDLTPLAAYGKFEVLEGDPIEGAVLIQFPDFAAAKAWYDSPAYQAAAQHRYAGAKYRGFIVEGLG